MQPKSHDAVQALANSVKRLLDQSENSIEGFTLDNMCLGVINSSTGYYVSDKNTQGNTGVLGAFKTVIYAQEHDLLVGGWSKDGIMCFDASVWFPLGKLKEAMEFAKTNEQYSIWDCANNIEIVISNINFKDVVVN
jgi:hypothetical protein